MAEGEQPPPNAAPPHCGQLGGRPSQALLRPGVIVAPEGR